MLSFNIMKFLKEWDGWGGETIGMRFSESWRGAAILVYWKVSQANLIAWRCEEIEALLRWVSVEEGCGGLPETLWNGGENKVTCNRPSWRIFLFCSYPCMNCITVNKDNLEVRPVQTFSQTYTCWRCALALFVKLTFLYRSWYCSVLSYDAV